MRRLRGPGILGPGRLTALLRPGLVWTRLVWTRLVWTRLVRTRLGRTRLGRTGRPGVTRLRRQRRVRRLSRVSRVLRGVLRRSGLGTVGDRRVLLVGVERLDAADREPFGQGGGGAVPGGLLAGWFGRVGGGRVRAALPQVVGRLGGCPAGRGRATTALRPSLFRVAGCPVTSVGTAWVGTARVRTARVRTARVLTAGDAGVLVAADGPGAIGVGDGAVPVPLRGLGS
jgi:hypothetical protein